MPDHLPRRNFLRASAAASFTTSLFTGQVKGANDRIATAFIGVGRMGQSNLSFAMKQENMAVVAACDVYEPNLLKAVDMSKSKARPVRDFREILADKAIDAVCISTPDHWHAYMAVEACKAGKDVYVEKPVCVAIEEGRKMVDAARKYKRVVQAGTMQRSAEHFQQAVKLVGDGVLGQVTVVRTWNVGLAKPEGIGNPADGAPPKELNWDLWLGPAAKREFNANRFGVDPKAFSHFRWFWDYAGGMMTDWGVHWLDIVQMAFKEVMPKSVVAQGASLYLKDNRETPDTLLVSYEYPGFLASYENRSSSSLSLVNGKSGGILFHGTEGTMFVDRGGFEIFPEPKSSLQPMKVERTSSGNQNHWNNFAACIKSREKPISDIETCYRSSATCLLGNIALRSKARVDWDAQKESIVQPELRKWMQREYRKPWKLSV
jgi:predicted dehydrogenase